MRVAVTGAAGRLGRAVVGALEEAPFTGPFGPIAWTRAIFDLDAPESIGALLDRDRPELVVHCAAWTDVDGCAREPELAMRRNAGATEVLARATAGRGLDLIVVSTNEVFDGRRADARPYRPDDGAQPINAYGRSKLAAERAASAAYDTASGALGIVRTAWLFGPPGNDFPSKILAAADRANAAGGALRLVEDEIGSPSYTVDVAEAIAELIGAGAIGGIRHVVNRGAATRREWAEEVLRRAGVSVQTVGVAAAEFARASSPPRHAALEPSALPGGDVPRDWRSATADYMPALLRQRGGARAG